MNNIFRIDPATATTAELVEFFNAHCSEAGHRPVKRFADRAAAIRRVNAMKTALHDIYGPGATDPKPQAEEPQAEEQPSIVAAGQFQPQARNASVRWVLVDESAYVQVQTPDRTFIARITDPTPVRLVAVGQNRRWGYGDEALLIMWVMRALEQGACDEFRSGAATAWHSIFRDDSWQTLLRDNSPAPFAKASVSGRRSSGRSALAGGRIIPLCSENPRKPESFGWRSYNLVLADPGLTYEQYMERGGRNNDLRWDLDHGFAEVQNASGEKVN